MLLKILQPKLFTKQTKKHQQKQNKKGSKINQQQLRNNINSRQKYNNFQDTKIIQDK